MKVEIIKKTYAFGKHHEPGDVKNLKKRTRAKAN